MKRSAPVMASRERSAEAACLRRVPQAVWVQRTDRRGTQASLKELGYGG
jgi:hypothetical protein